MQNEPSPQPQPLQSNGKRPVNKVLVWTGVGLIGVLGLLFIFFVLTTKTHLSPTGNASSSPSTQISQASPSQYSVPPLPHIDTVVLTDKGFTPSKITVKKGNAVKWVNNSSTDNASVSSDDYPTNQRFPEMNLGKFDGSNALSHIFETPGTYTYHNQFNPKQTGTVIVE